jgi:hypothetical protein
MESTGLSIKLKKKDFSHPKEIAKAKRLEILLLKLDKDLHLHQQDKIQTLDNCNLSKHAPALINKDLKKCKLSSKCSTNARI